MAGDWIKMRRGLRHDPKVVAMARFLAGDRAFMNWWSDPQQSICHENVTEVVTFANVTRVTVCGLLDVWSALNNTLSSDCRAAFMTLQDLDDIAEIPGFGIAMEQVGWVSEKDGEGLVFENFTEHNTLAKNRSVAASDAERAKAYRERKKAREAAAQKTVTIVTSRHAEKRREDIVQQQQQQHAREPEVVAGGIDPGPPLPSVFRLHPHCTQLEAEEWAQRHDRSTADGVRITPEIVVTWWEDRTRSDWQIAKHGTLIPLTTERAVETDLVSYARSWAKNEISRPQTHAQKRTAREIPSAVLTEPLPRL